MDKRISFVVPIYKTAQYLDRCLRSLINQDWSNKEIVCVFDGPDKESEKIIKDLKKFFPSVDVSYKVIDHGGACKARNEGAKLANGDILSFFNSDYVAVPGMARTWMEAFEDFPDCGFVYGGYGWIDPQKNPLNGEYAGYYGSEEFDAFKLENYNYIDCGNPIRKEVFKPWDENCKSLQDWDFFLRIVKSGVKGKFIKDIVYSAELPRPKGLSDDSSNNWIERVRYVKKNHGIKENDVVITSIGAPLHALRTAKMIGADFKGYTMPVNFKPHNYKMIYLIGCYTGKEKNFSNLSVFRGSSKDCIKVIHWVGADIYWLRALTFEEVKFIMPKLQKEIDYHFVECEQMQKEMADYGLKTEILPIPPPDKYEMMPTLPAEFTIAVMKTDKSDFDKYCGNLMDEVMAALPNVKFKVFGDGKCNRKLDNVENSGYVKMHDLIDKSSCFLRIVRHDGMMMAANEFVMCGRDAITNLEMPYMDFVDTQVNHDNWDKFGGGFNELSYPDTKAKIIEKILEVKNRSYDCKNRSIASDYYKKLLNPHKFKNKVYGLLK
jgi:glycosyltransferase involved in cell wall biosynthesis